MKIIRVNTGDYGGGAERIARVLFQAERQAGHTTRLVVSNKRSDDPDIMDVLKPPEPGWLGRWLLQGMALLKPQEATSASSRRMLYTNPRMAIKRLAGREIFDFPNTYRLFDLAGFRPDILHLHNLHSHAGYFDLRALPWFSRQLPVMVTLHDAWLLSGHCAHSFDCQRWRTGCGHCPYLATYPSQRRDATAANWKAKRSIYQHSRLYIAAPSQWMMNQVHQSILRFALVESRVIPEGVDLAVFRPHPDKEALRTELGLPLDRPILLFAASGIRSNPFKDYATLRGAFEIIAHRRSAAPVLLLALGESGASEIVQGSEIRFVPFLSDPGQVARYYQAADLYLHAARADTFPSTVLEALACGTPVVATTVGGIGEQIQDGQTGFLTPPGNAAELAERVLQLLREPGLRRGMSQQAAEAARRRFDQQLMAAAYQDWFALILAGQQPD